MTEILEETGFIWVFLSFVIYSVVHSLLATLKVKSWVKQVLGTRIWRGYRLFFVVFVSLALLPVLGLILFLPDRVIYTIPFPWMLLTSAVQLFALWGLLRAFRYVRFLYFIGLSQLSQEDPSKPEPFVVKGVYQWVRHPLYFFSLLFIWSLPVMTWNILAFNLAASLYMWIGSIFEEQKLVIEFGDAYRQYRRKTPAILPWPRKK